MDIQVGDRVTYKYLESNKQITMIVTTNSEISELNKMQKEYLTNSVQILKIERPKYEVVEEKKELLTEEEKEFLKQYIKIIENLNNGKVESINRSEIRITVYLKTGLSYHIEVGTKFSNMKKDITYTLKELGLEKVEDQK